MELKSFRIKNFRSIKDTGPCYLSGDNITILAGKNESGKTAILEALEDFNQGKAIRDTAINIHHTEFKPEIILGFQIDTETLSEISNNVGMKLKPNKPINIEFIKNIQIPMNIHFRKQMKKH